MVAFGKKYQLGLCTQRQLILTGKYSLCAQRSLCVSLRVPYGVPGIQINLGQLHASAVLFFISEVAKLIHSCKYPPFGRLQILLHLCVYAGCFNFHIVRDVIFQIYLMIQCYVPTSYFYKVTQLTLQSHLKIWHISGLVWFGFFVIQQEYLYTEFFNYYQFSIKND